MKSFSFKESYSRIRVFKSLRVLNSLDFVLKSINEPGRVMKKYITGLEPFNESWTILIKLYKLSNNPEVLMKSKRYYMNIKNWKIVDSHKDYFSSLLDRKNWMSLRRMLEILEKLASSAVTWESKFIFNVNKKIVVQIVQNSVYFPFIWHSIAYKY